MSNFVFGEISESRLSTVYIPAQKIVRHALQLSDVDFSVICGHRNLVDQLKAYSDGNSPISGVDRYSHHNFMPSLAVDLCPYVEGIGLVWDDSRLWESLVKAMFLSKNRLYGKNYYMEWGGNWQKPDKPHFQFRP